MDRGAFVGALASGILAAAISALVTVYVTSKTISSQNALTRTQAQDAFVLAAAQYVMGQRNCQLALQKARVLRAIFPNRLGQSFGSPIQVAVGRYRYDANRHEYIPLPDPTGCTSHRPIPVTKQLSDFWSKGNRTPLFGFTTTNPFKKAGAPTITITIPSKTFTKPGAPTFTITIPSKTAGSH